MGIRTMTGTTHLDRRTLLDSAALVGGGLWAPGAALAASGDMKTIRAAVDKQLPENIARIQDWIKHPAIAAENWQMDAACDFTIGLLRDAGFQMVKKMPTDGHTPAIDGWFDNVRQLSPREKQLIAQTAASNSEAEAKKALGVKMWINDEPWLAALERQAGQPTINIQGLVGGYTGLGGKTVLPGRVEAKLECRLVPY